MLNCDVGLPRIGVLQRFLKEIFIPSAFVIEPFKHGFD